MQKPLLLPLVPPVPTPTWPWWRGRQRTYNRGLFAASVVAFVWLIVLQIMYDDRINAAMLARNNGDPGEFTLVTIMGQGFMFAVAMALANVCYQVGPVTEHLLRPRNVDAFRRWVFGLGLIFSMALPFSLPLIVLCNWG